MSLLRIAIRTFALHSSPALSVKVKTDGARLANEVRKLCTITAKTSKNQDGVASPLPTPKKRIVKKKTVVNPNIMAFATCDEYSLEKVAEILRKQDLYKREELPSESDALYAKAKYPIDDQQRDLFVFENGTIVFWNFPLLEARSILNLLKSSEESPFDEEKVLEEHETMEFQFHNGKTKITNSRALLSNSEDTSHEDTVLEKYAISNGVATSVKLAIWEATFEEFITSIEGMLKDITQGRKLSVTRKHMFKQTGELFEMRHKVNLSSDLLDAPDFYWDRDYLEMIFSKTCSLYAIERRRRVMNEKIAHCQELLELISHHLEDKHHVRLELMIIILIVVEVIFECVHYIERYSESMEGN